MKILAPFFFVWAVVMIITFRMWTNVPGEASAIAGCILGVLITVPLVATVIGYKKSPLV